MKKRYLFLTFGLALGLGIAGAKGLGRKAETIKADAAVDTTSYTMNASELLGSSGFASGADISETLVDGSMRVTSNNGGQFFLVFQNSNDYSFKDLIDDCTSITVKMRISDATKWSNVLHCQDWGNDDVESYQWQNFDLNAAADHFIDLTFNKTANSHHIGRQFSMIANEIGAYVDFKSITFSGLTTFETRKFIKIQGDWNYWNRNNGTHSTLLEFASTFVETSGDSVNYAKQVGDKITLNGHPFKEAGNVDHAHGGPYLQLTYVDEFMASTTGGDYPNAVISINDALVFEKTIIEPVRIVFDSTEQKWHVENLLKDDLLVRNSDYTLFTPSDYDFGGGHDYWIYYSKAGEPIEELTGNQSFGLRFTMRCPSDGTGYFKIGFGPSITSDNYLLLYHVFDKIYIEKFDGQNENYQNVTNESMVQNVQFNDDVEHVFELYMIRDSANTVVILFGVDGVQYFKTSSLTVSGNVEGDYFVLRDFSEEGKMTVGSCADTDEIALDKFAVRRLHSEDISKSDNRETGNCAGADGYYAKAKTYYNTILNQSQRKAFATEASYADMRARFIAWAAASGENISLDVTTGAIIVANRNYLGAGVTNKNNLMIVIVVISISMLSLCTLAVILKKRKAHN